MSLWWMWFGKEQVGETDFDFAEIVLTEQLD